MSDALSISTSEHWRGVSPVLALLSFTSFLFSDIKQLFNISTDPSIPPIQLPHSERPWSHG